MTTPPVALAIAGLLALSPRLLAQEPASAHQHDAPQSPAPTAPADDHSEHEHQAPPLPAFIPPLNEADREAAFPDLLGHGAHDMGVNDYVLFDQLEWQRGGGHEAVSWDTRGWIGGDRHRFWFRSEGDRVDGFTEQAQTNLLYGVAIAPWWDLVAGVRLDTLPQTPRSALAVGVQGLAPYRVEVQASAYIEPSGRTHVRIETEYEQLITNRLVLQPLVEFEIYGRADRERGFDAGVSTGEIGLRFRYEVRREFAPYVGVVWSRKFFGTADLARAAAKSTAGARLAVGLRTWF